MMSRHYRVPENYSDGVKETENSQRYGGHGVGVGGVEGSEGFKRVCSANSSAAGFQEDLCLWDLAIILVWKQEY